MGAEDRNGRELGAVALQLAASLALYFVVEADSADVQALRMRFWHYTARGSQWTAGHLGRLGILAERRYNEIKS